MSLYHTFCTLRGYAAHQMRQTGPEPERRYFLWSSLPLEFNADPAARMAAADYLEGRGRADILPLRYRELIVRFGEELTLLDENLAFRWKTDRFQRPGRNLPGLWERLDVYYMMRRERPALMPEQLAAGLSGAAGPSLAYTVSEDGREVQVARGAIRTSSDRALVLEMRRGHGTIHLETEGV